ncbi:MAG: divalent metal cation transporter [Candidatus Kaiserbacteria bacterium]|nr:divalent metal cation transporter [Candidatus Kaiserbacteria bacterium]
MEKDSPVSETMKEKKTRFGRLTRIFGPGLITGAVDDDPSGIATYSQTGAQFGFGQLWTALYQLPLIIAIQEACARIGAVTGKGLAGVVKEHYSKKLLIAVVSLVVIANTINIGADIGAVAGASQLIFNLPFAFYAIAAVTVSILLEIFISYRNYAKFLKFLALSLLAYPVTALIVHEPWGQIITATIIPHIEFSFQFFFIVVGVFGTTITPYMFFWQASGEVEEEIAHHRLAQKGGIPHGVKKFLKDVRIDTTIGMFAAELAQWFIIITTATVLFSHGVTNINTAADAAKALEPLVRSFHNSGQLAKDIFAVGIIGLGLLAIPVLAGSTAYAMSEAFNWREGLYRKFNKAKGFYGIIIVSMLVGLAMNFVGINPIKALVFAAVFNGITAVPLLFMINKINKDEAILGVYKGSRLSQSVIWISFVIMGTAAISMFYTLFA